MQTVSYAPMPSRKDLMSLSTITQSDQLPKVKRYFKQQSSSLQTRDIEGAQPRLPGYGFIHKPEFSNVTSDIERAQPTKLHPAVNRPEFSLMTADIDYAQPCSKDFKTTRIGHNPLEPVYNLPKFEIRPFTPPKFIRDSINPNDIDGAKPEAYNKWKTRDHLGVGDIDGARPKPEKLLKKPDLTDPKDINNQSIFRTTRTVNPLMPTYVHRDENGSLTEIGLVEGSHPKELVNSTILAHNRHLITKDIDGAKTGTVGVGPVGSRDRRNVRSPTDISDIEGAKAGSLSKGIRTLRNVNPISPQYNLPGASAEKQTLQPALQAIIPPAPADPEFTKNLGQFFATGQPNPTKSAPVVSKPAINKDLENASRKFYLDDGELSPLSRNAELQRAADKFYTPGPPDKNTQKFEQIHNPGTIHRAKPKFHAVDAEAPQYLRDTSNFYGGSQHGSRPASEHLHTDEIKTPDKGQVSGRNTDTGYRFSLSRGQIKTPSESQASQRSSITPGPTNPRQVGTHSSVLLSSAHKVFSPST